MRSKRKEVSQIANTSPFFNIDFTLYADHLHKCKSALFILFHIFSSFCKHLSVLLFQAFRCKYLYLAIKAKHPTEKGWTG